MTALARPTLFLRSSGFFFSCYRHSSPSTSIISKLNPTYSPKTTTATPIITHDWRRTFAAPAKPAGKAGGGKPGGKPSAVEDDEVKEIVDTTPFSIDSLIGREDNPLLSSTPELRRAIRDLLAGFTDEEFAAEMASVPPLVTFKEFIADQVLPSERKYLLSTSHKVLSSQLSNLLA
eukprot:TRINITY_DN729_c3_g1_i1.p1 TRINITY_DN729_c3_g1~~TRINITY_DN729_c3_g1_i1.p1  ORF type:complete len:203 (-),score=59.89 TRINITY_DN729_c3_g1_i1:510-1037(-)